jgi:uncharacterized protein (TIGR02246 family)
MIPATPKLRDLLAATILLLVLLVSGLSSAKDSDSEVLIRKAMETYRTAWLANDPDQVLKTLTPDAILMPSTSAAPIAGETNIRAYWWPSNMRFTIDRFEQPLLEVEAGDSLAYARGTSHVVWTSSGKTTESDANFLVVLKKGTDGTWRIHRLCWYPKP